ncbi:hypothetical protein IPM19_00425 [bacterium]|nr:MAG: hypothetical protein IPM19_00425 [bacterium]
MEIKCQNFESLINEVKLGRKPAKETDPDVLRKAAQSLCEHIIKEVAEGVRKDRRYVIVQVNLDEDPIYGQVWKDVEKVLKAEGYPVADRKRDILLPHFVFDLSQVKA